MPSCLIQTFVLVLDVSIAKFAVLACAVGCWSVTTSLRALHLWQINTFCCHIYNGCVGIGAPLAQPGSSRRRRRGTSCPNEAVAAQATQSRAGSPHRDGMTERPLLAGAVVILLLLPFDHFFFISLFKIFHVWRHMDYPLFVGYILSWVGCVSLTLSFVTTTFMANAIGMMLPKRETCTYDWFILTQVRILIQSATLNS